MVFFRSAQGPLSHMRAQRYSPSDQFARKDYSTSCTLLKPQLSSPAGNNRTFLQVWPTCFEHIHHLYPTTPQPTTSAIFFSHVRWRLGRLVAEWWLVSAEKWDTEEHRVNKRNTEKRKTTNCRLFFKQKLRTCIHISITKRYFETSETTPTTAQVSDPRRTDYSSTPLQESYISQGI